ncbi:MAG: amino acid-binding ACT [Gemmataceae bacterium]|nr:amino acid-binding ACT [Gemmataceae bacterium]
MSFKWDRVHVWSGEIVDKPGGAAAKLALLAQAGANLEYVETQRLPNKPGFGMLYVAPVTGAAQIRAARAAGLTETDYPIVRRIEGDNEAGLAHKLTQSWALANISLQGLTMAVVGSKFVGYAAFDTVGDANRAAQILADLGVAPAAHDSTR